MITKKIILNICFIILFLVISFVFIGYSVLSTNMKISYGASAYKAGDIV